MSRKYTMEGEVGITIDFCEDKNFISTKEMGPCPVLLGRIQFIKCFRALAK